MADDLSEICQRQTYSGRNETKCVKAQIPTSWALLRLPQDIYCLLLCEKQISTSKQNTENHGDISGPCRQTKMCVTVPNIKVTRGLLSFKKPQPLAKSPVPLQGIVEWTSTYIAWALEQTLHVTGAVKKSLLNIWYVIALGPICCDSGQWARPLWATWHTTVWLAKAAPVEQK